MRPFKLSALGAAIVAISSLSATAQADFIDDSSFDIKLRNVHFDYETDTKNPDGSTKDWSEWSQGIEANFKSGYIGDVIGFDASYYGTIKLDQTGPDQHGSMGGQLLGKDGEGYHKLGQAYLKTKFGDEHLGFYGQAGYMSGSKGLILGSASRSTPSSYRGAHGEVNVDDFTVYGTYVDQISYRTESRWDDFTTKAGDTVDYAWQVGGTYNANNFDSELVFLESKDYHRQYLLNLGYTFDINEDTKVVVDGNFHKSEGYGDLFGKSYDNNGQTSKTGEFDDKAYHTNLNTQFIHGGLGVMLSYAQTEAEKTGGLGYFDYTFADNEYGATVSQVSRYVSDFMYDGEKVWQLSAGYNFADFNLPGLDTSLTYTRGTGIKDQTTSKMNGENETDLIIGYTIQDGTFKGMSFKAIKAWHTAKYDTKSDVDTEHMRVYLDYTISVF